MVGSLEAITTYRRSVCFHLNDASISRKVYTVPKTAIMSNNQKLSVMYLCLSAPPTPPPPSVTLGMLQVKECFNVKLHFIFYNNCFLSS